MRSPVLAVAFAAFIAPGFCPAEDIYAAASQVEINKEYVQELVARSALDLLGTPYVYAGVGKKGVDCSGLTYAAYLAATGRKLPRGTEELFATLPAVSGPLLPGDLVFFNTTGGVSHVGLALGGDRIIHAASRGPKTGVIISSLKETYYRTRYLGARRVFEYTAPVLYVTLGGTRIRTALAASLEAGRPFTLSVAHRRRGAEPAVCRLERREDGGRREVKRFPVPPGKETVAICSLDAPGDWFVSCAGEKTGEIVRIEVRVEPSHDSRPRPE